MFIHDLHAQSLFRLSEAQWRTRQNGVAIETAQKAIALFKEQGDPSGAGRADWSLAVAYNQLNHAEESRRAAQTALELCRWARELKPGFACRGTLHPISGYTSVNLKWFDGYVRQQHSR